jgi:YD repeat-containing protein
VSSSDAVTGENVSYTYDALNRLIAAASTGSAQWSGSYSYDGFGNLTSRADGGAPVLLQVDSTTNRARMTGDNGFDANGNWLGAGGTQSNTWNVENQLITNGTADQDGNLATYTYDPWGKRVLQYLANPVYGPRGTLYFCGITGQLLGTYGVTYVVTSQPPGGGRWACISAVGCWRRWTGWGACGTTRAAGKASRTGRRARRSRSRTVPAADVLRRAAVQRHPTVSAADPSDNCLHRHPIGGVVGAWI